jgi:NAD-dependent oxidoreductase involved in siderophore biosynthesis
VTGPGTGGAPTGGADPELEAALKRVLEVLYKEHPLSANQILVLSSELQRIGVHRLVEEHLEKFRRRQT